MMATSPISRKDILARRRGRQFTHNAMEDLPEDLREGADSHAEDGPQGAGGGGAGAGGQGGFTAKAAATLHDEPDAGPTEVAGNPATKAASAQETQESEAKTTVLPVNDTLLREEVSRRIDLEARLKLREQELAARDERLVKLQEQSAAMEALQAQFKETESQLAEIRRREFERNIERDVEAQVQKLLDEDTEGQLSHETANALARRVLAPAMSSMMAKFGENEARLKAVFEEKLKETNASLDTRINELNNQRVTDSLVRMNRKLQDKYPKFSELVSSKDYLEWGAQSPRFSLDSYSTLMSKAYAAHDTERVLELMGEFDRVREGKQSTLDGMAEVQVGQVSASRPAATKKEVTYSYEDLGEARRKLQNGEWNRKEFQAFKAKFEKAEKEGRIEG